MLINYLPILILNLSLKNLTTGIVAATINAYKSEEPVGKTTHVKYPVAIPKNHAFPVIQYAIVPPIVGLKNINVDIANAIKPKNQPRDFTPNQALRNTL
jgi:hypothetical protein